MKIAGPTPEGNVGIFEYMRTAFDVFFVSTLRAQHIMMFFLSYIPCSRSRIKDVPMP